MNKRVVLGLTVFALVDGFMLGLFAGMFAQPPMAATDAPLESDEYVQLVSAAYASDFDLLLARQRLSALQGDSSHMAQFVLQTARRTHAHHDTVHLNPLVLLARALGADVSELNDNTADSGDATPASESAPTAENTPTISAPSAPVVIYVFIVATLTSTMTVSPPKPTTTATATRTPTNAPPVVARLAATATATPTLRPAPVNEPGPGVNYNPNAEYRLVQVRRLTPCENGGNHNLFILVLDSRGNGIANMQVEVSWLSGMVRDTTGKKVENIPSLGITAQTTAGYANVPMFKGSYRVRVLNGVSDQTGWLTVDIPRDERCPAPDNPVANSLFHYSYLVVFQKVR